MNSCPEWIYQPMNLCLEWHQPINPCPQWIHQPMNYCPEWIHRPIKPGWRSGESARLPPMCPGFDSRTWRHMWVEFVVGSLLKSERFFSGYSGFPLSSKTNISKFQCDLDYCQVLYHGPLAWVIAQALLVFDIKCTYFLSTVDSSTDESLSKVNSSTHES